MKHITFFIFILLLQKSSNKRLYPIRIPVTAKYQDISYPLNPNSEVQMRGRVLPITPKSFKEHKHAGRVLKPSTAIKKKLMEFTPPPFKIPYAVTPVTNAKKSWINIPYSSPENYTQLKKINFHLKTKRLPDESKNDERKKDEDKRIEEQKRLSEQRMVVDAKKKLEILERELEMKRELPNREVVIPERETNVLQPLSAKDLIPKIETLKIQSPPMFAKENETNRKPQSDKSDSSSEELNVNWRDDDKISLYYDLDAEHELQFKLE